MSQQTVNTEIKDDAKFVRELLKENGKDISAFYNDDGTPKIVEDKTPAAAAAMLTPETPAAVPVAAANNSNPAAIVDDPEKKGEDTTATPDLDDEKVREYLAKKGIKIDKLDDLKPAETPLTDEEKAAKQKELRDNAIKYALNNKLLTTDEFKAFNVDAAKPPREIVFRQMADKWRETEKDLSDEDVDERFANYFKENLPEDNWERKERALEMQARANHYFNSKYSNVLNSESLYEKHTQEEEQTKVYKKRVDDVLAAFPTQHSFEIAVDVEGGKTVNEKYTFDFSKESIDTIRQELLSDQSVNRLGKAGADEATINSVVRSALIQKEFENAVKTVARSHANKMVLANKAGRKGVIPERAGEGTVEYTPPREMSEAEKMMRENKYIKN